MNRTMTLVSSLSAKLEAAGISYCITHDTALMIQGVHIDEPKSVEISVQWDLVEAAARRLHPMGEACVERTPDKAIFRLVQDGIDVDIVGFYNTVVETDPERIRAPLGDTQVWVKSVYAYIRRDGSGTDSRSTPVRTFLRAIQSENSHLNAQAWQQGTYDAWLARHGTPQEAATKLRRNPAHRLSALKRHLGDVSGKRIVNLMGSHGSKAVCLALLGADVTVVDISQENRRYALALAEEAGVTLQYVVADVLDMPDPILEGEFDLAVMELGILHYFVDLIPLFEVVERVLRVGGRFILQDFHPISTKLITSSGKRHKVTGNYFDPSLVETHVAFSKYGDGTVQNSVRLRRWTLGEIVTAVAGVPGFRIIGLDENPNHKIDDIGLPKTFTLIAEKREDE